MDPRRFVSTAPRQELLVFNVLGHLHTVLRSSCSCTFPVCEGSQGSWSFTSFPTVVTSDFLTAAILIDTRCCFTVLFCFRFFFLRRHPHYMEVPGPGTELEPQPPPIPQLWQSRVLQPTVLGWGREPTPPQKPELLQSGS